MARNQKIDFQTKIKMTVKKSFAYVTFSLLFALEVIPVQAIAEDLFFEELEQAPVEAPAEYYETSFVISAYYSPLPGQSFYTTGSYEGDIRLNGNGTNGADGTPVYPGMVAAPSSYSFGTKLYIPGIGMTTVHDRGGAIVNAGVRGHAYDRLDIWMGYGDAGLTRALQWGKRTVSGVLVYGQRPDIADNVYLEGYTAAEAFVQETFLAPLEFDEDLHFGSDSEEVRKMQDYLVQWGYLEEATGFYGQETAEALIRFQLDFEIIDGTDEIGAGHFGINTRKQFDTLINSETPAEEVVSLQRGSKLMSEKYTDLYEAPFTFSNALEWGSTGDEVTRLQTELSNLGYYGVQPNGVFDELTAHALFKFQQANGLVLTKEDSGAGYFGPASRRTLNSILQKRYETKSLLAFTREEIEKGTQTVEHAPTMVAVRKED